MFGPIGHVGHAGLFDLIKEFLQPLELDKGKQIFQFISVSHIT